MVLNGSKEGLRKVCYRTAAQKVLSVCFWVNNEGMDELDELFQV